MAEKKTTTKYRIVVPSRPGHAGSWIPGRHLPTGTHDVELPDEFEQAPGLPPASMRAELELQSQLGHITIVATGDDIELLAPAAGPVVPADGPENLPPPPPAPGEPGSPAKKLKLRGE